MIRILYDLILSVISNLIAGLFSPDKDSHGIVISGNKKTSISDSFISGSVSINNNKDVEITDVDISGVPHNDGQR